MSVAETSTILWRQRELLSMLRYKLELESMVLAAGRTRWLGQATREVELVLGQVQEAELLRAITVDDLAAELGLPPGPSLSAIVDALDEPWREVFAEHRKALVAVSAEIEAAVQANQELLTSGQRAVREALGVVGGSTGLYSANGSMAANTADGARFVDQAV